MSTATTHTTPAYPAPLEIPGPVAHVPPLDRLYQLTEVPDRRVVYRGVDWSFYEELADSIPEGSNIQVDYDGRDLEIMACGPDHEDLKYSLGQFVSLVAAEFAIPCKGLAETTWKRPQLSRGLEADQCYYFRPEKVAAMAHLRRSRNIADYPNPDLAIEVDISRPEVDRPGIYAALGVAEIWRFDGERIIIERLTPKGTYEPVEASGFLPVRAEEVYRWVVEEDTSDDTAWARRLRAEMKKKATRLNRAARRRGEVKSSTK
ncbi:MAG: Uma2 family endonuclease [Isosphaeraceae bacterium]